MSSLYAYPRQPDSDFHDNLDNLLKGAEHTHDIILEINNNQTFPAHKYIICMRSSYFRQHISTKQMDKLTIINSTNATIDPDIFQLILEYIYSNKCPWLSFVQKIRIRNENKYQHYLLQMNDDDDDDDEHRYFARLRRQQNSLISKNNHQSFETKSKKKKKTNRILF